jgi:hypothetical protein
MSTLEQKIINSTEPIHLADHEVEEIIFLNKPSIWLNKKECNEWQGPISLNSYKLNEDPNPDIIIKKLIQPVEYTQDIQIKYLQPPTPPPDGDLIIQQEKDIILDPLPPQIIRVYPPRPRTPPPLIIREKPPQPRPPKPVQIITIPGRVIRPPQRQIIIEHMPQVASRQITIEKPKYYSEFVEKKNLIFKQNLKNLNYLDIEIKVPKSCNRVVEIQIDHLNNHNQCSNRREIWTTSKTISYQPNWNRLSKTNNIDSSFMRFHENLKRTFWS